MMSNEKNPFEAISELEKVMHDIVQLNRSSIVSNEEVENYNKVINKNLHFLSETITFLINQVNQTDIPILGNNFLESENKALKKTNKELLDQIYSMQNRIVELESKEQSLKEEKDNYVKKIWQKDNQICELNQEISSINQTKEKIEKSNSKLENFKEEYKKLIKRQLIIEIDQKAKQEIIIEPEAEYNTRRRICSYKRKQSKYAVEQNAGFSVNINEEGNNISSGESRDNSRAEGEVLDNGGYLMSELDFSHVSEYPIDSNSMFKEEPEPKSLIDDKIQKKEEVYHEIPISKKSPKKQSDNLNYDFSHRLDDPNLISALHMDKQIYKDIKRKYFFSDVIYMNVNNKSDNKFNLIIIKKHLIILDSVYTILKSTPIDLNSLKKKLIFLFKGKHYSITFQMLHREYFLDFLTNRLHLGKKHKDDQESCLDFDVTDDPLPKKYQFITANFFKNNKIDNQIGFLKVKSMKEWFNKYETKFVVFLTWGLLCFNSPIDTSYPIFIPIFKSMVSNFESKTEPNEYGFKLITINGEEFRFLASFAKIKELWFHNLLDHGAIRENNN